MSQELTNIHWQVAVHTMRGASHLRSELPNQDAIQASRLPDGLPPIVLAVADGHGSLKSFRSDCGSQFAVEVAVEVCRKFLDDNFRETSVIKQRAEQQIPRDIFRRWYQRVDKHHARYPFTEEELEGQANSLGKIESDGVASDQQIRLAYGTTLLAVLVERDFAIYFQLGDGEILEVSEAGEVTHAIPRDESLIANETSSLCQEEVLKDFRCRIRFFQNSPPAIILLTTDGYPNSFASFPEFLKAGTDYLRMFQKDGFDSVNQSIPGWLEEASREGSGDDITLGLLVRAEPRLPVRTVTAPPDAQGDTQGADAIASIDNPPSEPVTNNPSDVAADRDSVSPQNSNTGEFAP